MGTRKEKVLWDSVKTLHPWSDSEKRILQGVCMLLAESTRKSPKAKSMEALPFSPGALHKMLLEDCSDHVNVATFHSSSFGKLGRKLQGINGLCADDLDYLRQWIQGGALDFWTEPPTWDHVVTHVVKWIAQARHWIEEMGPAETGESRIR